MLPELSIFNDSHEADRWLVIPHTDDLKVERGSAAAEIRLNMERGGHDPAAIPALYGPQFPAMRSLESQLPCSLSGVNI